MSIPSGYWCPILTSSELGKKPIARTRFGERLALWRSGDTVACVLDRCPHRSAALSLGRINRASGSLACTFHGLEFAADGRCVNVPVETDQRIRDDFCVKAYEIQESNGFIWMWRGQEKPTSTELPSHPALAGLRFGAATTVWPAHYTRCIENVCDYSHLPFVHRTTIGLRNRDPVINLEVEDVPGGFRAYLLQKGERSQCLEFLYPNMWLLMISERMMMSAVFAPMDDTQTTVYGRTYYKLDLPGMKLFMNMWTNLSQYLVFREDWPIVSSQMPGDIREAHDEKLLPSDSPVIAYRKLHRSYQ